MELSPPAIPQISVKILSREPRVQGGSCNPGCRCVLLSLSDFAVSLRTKENANRFIWMVKREKIGRFIMHAVVLLRKGYFTCTILEMAKRTN